MKINNIYIRTIQLCLSTGLLLLCWMFLSPVKAHAASLTVGGSCPLSDAITSINNGADENSCVATGSYGTDDTITIPAGTVTLSADLPAITADELEINGSGKTTTTIEAADFEVFSAANPGSYTISNLRIHGANDYAIYIGHGETAVLDRLDIDDSDGCIFLQGTHLTVSNSEVHDCSSTSASTAGIYVGMQAYGDTEVVVSAAIVDCVITDNSGIVGGLSVEANAADENDRTLTIARTNVLRNNGVDFGSSPAKAGVNITIGSPAFTRHLGLSIDASTVADNTATATIAQPEQGVFHESGGPRIAGFLLSVANLDSAIRNFTNVTVANNQSINHIDPQIAVAGFMGIITSSTGQNVPLTLVNTTVVNNSMVQDIDNTSVDGNLPAFFLIMAIFVAGDENFGVPSIVIGGGSATNALIANNRYNDTQQSCVNNFVPSFIGINTPFDMTPSNSGHNMTDDTNCTGYNYQPNLYSTLGPLQDNGGPVLTIALLEGSPAIGAGGQVLGISTDARGIARPANPDIGAYQSTFAASISTTNGNSLAKTGLYIALASPIGLLLITGAAYSYVDYQRHKRPLYAEDPSVDYSYWHHLKVVSVPLVKYRLSFTVDRPVSTKSKHIKRFWH